MRCNFSRAVDGILLLDKPKKLSSNIALQTVRRLFNAKKAGHTGSLDPLATGMLPICLGKATKFSQFLLNADKYYRVIGRLGQRTNTADAYGEIISERKINITKQQLDQALDKFRGHLMQLPSMYSALKYRGIPLYKYARQGITIKRTFRAITIYDLKLTRWEKNEVELDIFCSKGTYIRTIIDDLGELLGCGAHVIYLRRIKIGNYLSKSMVTLEQLNYFKERYKLERNSLEKKIDLFLLPIDTAVNHFPEINISENIATYFKQGQSIFIDKNSFINNNIVRVTEGNMHKFIGVAKIVEKNRIVPFCVILENV
ncbi:tRNA pseudouridine(55) synthase TruB [Arsenophonus symbiont of Ornithomya chloropus]|uniref:tRNA pseudouridine(55) synthase TruB n=1 Tax=Arsenophonus symbiont of Ornithomya chloropus TaxID=634121 RepID=UPI0032B2ECD3